MIISNKKKNYLQNNRELKKKLEQKKNYHF